MANKEPQITYKPGGFELILGGVSAVGVEDFDLMCDTEELNRAEADLKTQEALAEIGQLNQQFRQPYYEEGE